MTKLEELKAAAIVARAATYAVACAAREDAVDAQWAALKADWAASAAYRAELKKTQKENSND
jgi:hypothetical protein